MATVSFLLLALSAVSPVLCDKQPNVVLFLVDDQDMLLNGMKALPKTNEIFETNGLKFTNAFVSTPVCCVSRSTILTGKYVHNHVVSNNTIYGNCASTVFIKQEEPVSFASYIYKEQQHKTFFIGKYLNFYGLTDMAPTTHVPIGWTDWYAIAGDSAYYEYTMSNNGEELQYGSDDTDYLTWVIRDKAIQFMNDRVDLENEGFVMFLSFPAAHLPWTPPDKYTWVEYDDSLEAPRTPNFNAFNDDGTNSDKGPVLRQHTAMSDDTIRMADLVYKRRHGTLMAVDDVIDDIYKEIERLGELDNTYFIYTSDHGFHMGQYGLHFGKKLLYETDLRIPFYINGPGVAKGAETSKVALNVDIASTICDLTIGYVPGTMDGESLIKYFDLSDEEETVIASAKQEFLVEYNGEKDIMQDASIMSCPSKVDEIDSVVCDTYNNTYRCVRSVLGETVYTFDGMTDNTGSIFCQYMCYDESHVSVECEKGTVENGGEYYDLNIDPWQLTNTMSNLDDYKVANFKHHLQSQLSCSGDSCRDLRFVQSDHDLKKSEQSSSSILMIVMLSVVILLLLWAVVAFKYQSSFLKIQKQGKYNGYAKVKTTYNSIN